LGNPDMRTPIAHALSWPRRVNSGVAPLDLIGVGRLDFETPDFDRFPCLRLGVQAAAEGGGASTVLNAANEISVAAFLAGRIAFPDIARINESVLAGVSHSEPESIDAVLALDSEARADAVGRVARVAA